MRGEEVRSMIAEAIARYESEREVGSDAARARATSSFLSGDEIILGGPGGEVARFRWWRDASGKVELAFVAASEVDESSRG